jgi:hypothetical protein
MKKLTFTGLIFLFIFSASWCFADSQIPNLVGKWEIKAEGGMLLRSDKAGEKTHWVANQTSVTIDVDIYKQTGRVFFGKAKSKRATEEFIGVIGPDNKTLYFADSDGFLDGKIINKDEIEHVYRHVSPKDTVAAVGIWTRKK